MDQGFTGFVGKGHLQVFRVAGLIQGLRCIG